jgi:RimJ/RimL family protein N-acetyltransferase
MAIEQPPILLDVPEQLITERMLLRIPCPGDSKFIWPAVVDSQKELAPWMPWAYPQAEEQKVEEFCRRAASNFIMREQFHYSLYLRDTETCIGTCGIARAQWHVPSMDIGYWLRTPYCGKGYINEALRAVERVCFDALRAQRVTIHCDERNVRSGRVAQRAGYTLEGILRHNERAPAGELRNTCVYAKIAATT